MKACLKILIFCLLLGGFFLFFPPKALAVNFWTNTIMRDDSQFNLYRKAIEEENLNLCPQVGEFRGSTPVHMSSSSMLCEAILKNDLSVCERATKTWEKEQCKLAIFLLRNKYPSCEEFSDPDYKLWCEAVSNKKFFDCQGLSAVPTSNECYIDVALAYEDPSACENKEIVNYFYFSKDWLDLCKEVYAKWQKPISPEELPSPQETDLKTLMSNYYYFRHMANQRMGWHFWDWGLKAVFPKTVKAIERLFTIVTDPRKFFVYLGGAGELVEKIEKTKEGLGNFLQMAWRRDWLAATCLVGNLAAEERDADPLSALLFGGAYTECMINRAKDYYAKTLGKLKAEDPSYCVFQETCAGQSRCYKNWFAYWQTFRPEGDLAPLPRGEVATKKAEELWLEKTKFGEFSDGTKYTVKEIAGEEWQDAFEDVSWPERRTKVPFLSPKEKAEDPCPPVTTPTPTQPLPTTTGPMKNVALQANGGKATADSFGSYAGIDATAEKGNDGDKNNFWAGTGTPGWYQVEFDKIYSIGKIAIYTYYHTQTFNIELSKDGSSWTKVVSETRTKDEKPSGVGENDEKTFEITPTEAKYIKVNILDSDAPGSHIWQTALLELEAFTSSEGKEAEKLDRREK